MIADRSDVPCPSILPGFDCQKGLLYLTLACAFTRTPSEKALPMKNATLQRRFAYTNANIILDC